MSLIDHIAAPNFSNLTAAPKHTGPERPVDGLYAPVDGEGLVSQATRLGIAVFPEDIMLLTGPGYNKQKEVVGREYQGQIDNRIASLALSAAAEALGDESVDRSKIYN